LEFNYTIKFEPQVIITIFPINKEYELQELHQKTETSKREAREERKKERKKIMLQTLNVRGNKIYVYIAIYFIFFSEVPLSLTTL